MLSPQDQEKIEFYQQQLQEPEISGMATQLVQILLQLGPKEGLQMVGIAFGMLGMDCLKHQVLKETPDLSPAELGEKLVERGGSTAVGEPVKAMLEVVRVSEEAYGCASLTVIGTVLSYIAANGGIQNMFHVEQPEPIEFP